MSELPKLCGHDDPSWCTRECFDALNAHRRAAGLPEHLEPDLSPKPENSDTSREPVARGDMDPRDQRIEELTRICEHLQGLLGEAGDMLQKAAAERDQALARVKEATTENHKFYDESRVLMAMRDEALREVDRLREALEGDNLTAKRVYKLMEQRDALARQLDSAVEEIARLKGIEAIAVRATEWSVECQEEAERLRTALEWYADEKNYDEETGAAGIFGRTPSTPDNLPEGYFEADWGERARQALQPAAPANPHEHEPYDQMGACEIPACPVHRPDGQKEKP